VKRSQPLFGGRALVDWIRAGGRIERSIPAHSAKLRWHAHWFERNWRTQVKLLRDVRLSDDPVFIVGPWRSGTTLLQELLAAATTWPTPRTWQCFNPSTCFLTGAPARISEAQRPMDQGRIATLGPQEDEFALLLLGESSLYRGFIDPRRLREGALRTWTGEQGLLARWQEFLRGIVMTGSPGRLLLKSPGHTFRLPLLRTLFPRADFIWIGRSASEVLASNARMWRAMFETHALWDCPPGELEGFLHDMILALTGVLGRCMDEMPRDRMLWVTFEEVQAAPRQTVERVLRFLLRDVPFDEAIHKEKIEAALARVPIHAGSRASLQDYEGVHRLDGLMNAARQRFGGLETAAASRGVSVPLRPVG